jgi:hypothetical protein
MVEQIAIYAAVLSTITGVFQVLSFWRDRPRIKISTRLETLTFDMDGMSEVGEIVTLVIVANGGRRPITITSIGARLLFPKGFVNFVCNPVVPVALTESRVVSALADEEKIDFAEVEAWEAHDAIGRSYQMKRRSLGHSPQFAAA